MNENRVVAYAIRGSDGEIVHNTLTSNREDAEDWVGPNGSVVELYAAPPQVALAIVAGGDLEYGIFSTNEKAQAWCATKVQPCVVIHPMVIDVPEFGNVPPEAPAMSKTHVAADTSYDPGAVGHEAVGRQQAPRVDTLGDALPREMTRVRDEVLPEYLKIKTGIFAASMMRQSLDAAQKALAEGDVIAMLVCYEDLQGYHL